MEIIKSGYQCECVMSSLENMKILGFKESSPSPQNTIFIQLFMFYSLIPSIKTTTFDYSNFGTTPLDIVFQGDAYATPNGIQLNSDSYSQQIDLSIGRALYAKPVRLWDSAAGKLASFNTSFSFVMSFPAEGAAGDGMSFFLAPEGSAISPNSGGGYLGLTDSRQGVEPSVIHFVAVEFDTYANDWDPYKIDEKKSHHIGININSIKSVNTSDATILTSNLTATATIRYDSVTKTLSVYFHRASEKDKLFVSHIVDLKNVLPEWVIVGLSATRGTGYEFHRIISWKFDSTDFSSNQEIGGKKENKSKAAEAIGLAVSILFLIVLLGFFLCLWQKKKKKKKRKLNRDQDHITVDLSTDVPGPKKYSYSELIQATDNFSKERKLGEGGYGSVYRGTLNGDSNLEVAVKKTVQGSEQGERALRSEVNIISQLRHKNLVQLLGWCHSQGELLLVYDFMPKGSLDFYLYKGGEVLSWFSRYKVAKDLGQALLYLHEGWNKCVVHRDIKSSNIMLDSGYSAKLGDFGLARFADHIRGLKTTKLAGTHGYMAPECFDTGKCGKESDVYSFGVVALEIACGRRVLVLEEEANKVNLVTWVRELYLSGKLVEAADAKLGNDFDDQQLQRLMVVGLWCATHDPNRRPHIKDAIRVLDDKEAPVPDLKKSLHTDSMPAILSNGYSHISSSRSGGIQGIEMQASSSSHNKNSSRSTTFHSASASASLLHS